MVFIAEKRPKIKPDVLLLGLECTVLAENLASCVAPGTKEKKRHRRESLSRRHNIDRKDRIKLLVFRPGEV